MLYRVHMTLLERSERMRALDSCVKVATRLNVVNPAMVYALILRAKYFYNIGDYKNCYCTRSWQKNWQPVCKNKLPNASYYAQL